MKVSLITTVKDAADAVGPFLASLAVQTRQPDEVVVVDGGSTDGTAERLRDAEGITLIEEPGANIARGRNVAIAAATHDVIAVTDADCVLEPGWLERLLVPLGPAPTWRWAPTARSPRRSCRRAWPRRTCPTPTSGTTATFMPSGRSVAFRREAMEAAGGYPEWLDIGEDMVVDHRWRELGLDMRLARDAVVLWRPRATLRATWTQYFRYARGDAIAGMWPERHALRFAVYSGALYASATRGKLRKLAALAGAGAYAAGPLRRAMERFEDPADRAKAAIAVPALMAFTDTAKMAGYLAGLPKRDDRSRARTV